MLEILVVAVAGTVAAGLWDLFTTEVPDRLPYALIGIGVLYWLGSGILTSDYTPLMFSLAVGTLLLSVGMILYRKNQWGGADAWVLAAVGYMVPFYGDQIFIVPYLMNFMIVSIAYTVLYALVMGALNPRVFGLFSKDIQKNLRFVAIPPVLLLIALLLYPVYSFVTTLAFLTFMVVFWRYAVVVENSVFKKKVSASRLKKGDVLEKGKWIGLTEKDLRKLKARKTAVVVKDGVRFVPVFPITLAVTLLYGNLFLIIF